MNTQKVKLVGELSVEKKKSKSGNYYYALICDLGYSKKIISVNINDIAELLGVSVIEVVSACEVASLDKK